MDEETQKHIFEPFFTTKETGKGTGLGLSMVYGVIKQLDGYVWVTSETNGGTTFDIYFPFQHIKAEPEPLTNGNGAKYRGAETILLVEDEDVVRQLSRSILESCGYTVIEASNGIEASTAFLPIADKVDLLMTDVVMPEMSGQELAEKLTVIKPGLKVLFTSGYLDNPVPIKRGIDEGADFIQKPFSFDVLARKIRTVLDKSHENHH
jgi:CheY-like chemotaxis protein